MHKTIKADVQYWSQNVFRQVVEWDQLINTLNKNSEKANLTPKFGKQELVWVHKYELNTQGTKTSRSLLHFDKWPSWITLDTFKNSEKGNISPKFGKQELVWIHKYDSKTGIQRT